MRTLICISSCSLAARVKNLTKKCSLENNLEIDDLTVCLIECASNGEDKHICKTVLASLVTNIQLPGRGENKNVIMA